MAWKPNIPLATDAFSRSQGDIEGNFQYLNSIVTSGQLPFLTLPLSVSAPSFSAGVDGLYNLNNATTSLNELYVHKQTSAGTADIPMTASILSTAIPVSNSTGWTYLPSGILLRWGQGSGTGNITYTIGLPGPAFTTILSVQLTPVTTGGDPNINIYMGTILSNTQFTVYLSNRTTTGAGTGVFNVLIIGY